MDLTGYAEAEIERLMTAVPGEEIDLSGSADGADKRLVKCPKCGFEHEVTA
jgi:hypothetical protein